MTLSVRARTLLACLCVFLLAASGTSAAAEDTAPRQAAYQIQSVEWERKVDEYQLRIAGNTTPAYTIYELFDPLRIVIDVADAALGKSVSLPLDLQQGPVTRVTGVFLGAQQPVITRIEVFLAQDYPYSVERLGNDIQVKFAKEKADESDQEEGSATTGEQVNQLVSSLAQKPPAGRPAPAGSAIAAITVDKGPATTRVNIISDASIIDFEHFQLKKSGGKPDRMYIDIPNIGFTGSEAHQTVGTALARVRAARRANGVRIVFDSGLDRLFGYTITPTDQGLTVSINETGGVAPPAAVTAKSEPARLTSRPSIPAEVKETSTAPAAATPTGEEKPVAGRVASALEEFDFGGYNKQKITVDFFKIDLHNVFRMFREISGQNIVVDEGVAGFLTLSLNDVPWDFALDVILNLKDLQKEERFNTIVILPKNKSLSWPKRPTDNIALKTDGSMVKVEALTVTKKQEIPAALTEANKLIMQGQTREKAGDYPGALGLYEEAFDKWRDNGDLAGRISMLCLTHLGQYAKAVHYARQALKLNPNNYDVALQAAVAQANMKKPAEAKVYFDLAVRATRPASEALASYAAFNEENGDYDRALALLDKQTDFYGATLDTMVAKARVFDKKGDEAKAIGQYRDILLSGVEVPPDLLRYIKGRIAMSAR